MKRLLFLTIALTTLLNVAEAQPLETLLERVKNHPAISWGGCDVLQLEEGNYLVAVASVDVGPKKLPQLRTVGAAKAKRELLTMINGSNITSTTAMTTSEEMVDVDGKQTSTIAQTFFESIRENAAGWVNGMSPLGMWYSDDKTVFFYAIYKSIN